MTLLAHYDIELHQMTVKTIFQNRNLDEKVYMDQEGFLVEENKIYYVNLINQYTYLNKLPNNSISNLMILFIPLDLRKTLLTSIYI